MDSYAVDSSALARSSLTAAIFARLGKAAGAGPQCSGAPFAAGLADGLACAGSSAVPATSRHAATAAERIANSGRSEGGETKPVCSVAQRSVPRGSPPDLLTGSSQSLRDRQTPSRQPP